MLKSADLKDILTCITTQRITLSCAPIRNNAYIREIELLHANEGDKLTVSDKNGKRHLRRQMREVETSCGSKRTVEVPALMQVAIVLTTNSRSLALSGKMRKPDK